MSSHNVILFNLLLRHNISIFDDDAPKKTKFIRIVSFIIKGECNEHFRSRFSDFRKKHAIKKKGFLTLDLLQEIFCIEKIHAYISVPINSFTHFLFCLLYCREMESRFPKSNLPFSSVWIPVLQPQKRVSLSTNMGILC